MPEYVHPTIESIADSPDSESALEVVVVPAPGNGDMVRSALAKYAIGDVDETPSGMLVTYIAEPDINAVRHIDGLQSITPNASQGALEEGN